MPLKSDIFYNSFTSASSGANPPVVLIHGAGGNLHFWPPGIRRLPGYNTLALDLPGHGKSPGRGRQSIDAYAADILKWMGAIELNRAVFIGHSMGSAIAIWLALNHPEVVLGLGLIGAGASLRVHPDLLDSTSSVTTFDNAVVKITQLSFSPSASERLVELATKRMLETRQSVLYGDLRACDEFDETLHISNILQSTIIICGIDDKMTPVRYSHFLSSNIPGSELEIIPDAGHMVMIEHPQTVAFAINRLMNKIRL
jgi:pimeloyl-ACP methyl ester carboxylesterase